ncbi:unnamed protein product [Effrenium voratum]|nr:unnamed protein product [Effrenium voratum]
MKLPPAESTALAQRRPGGQGHIHEEPERGFSRPVLPRSATVASPERSGARGGRGNLLAGWGHEPLGEPSEWKRSGGNVNNGQLAETLIQQQVSLLEAELLREAAMGRDVDIQEQLERFELKMRMALAQRTVEGTDERTWHMEAEEQQQWRLQNLQRAGEGEDRHKQPAAAHPIPMTSGRSGASPGSDFQRHRAVRKTSGRSGSASPGSDFQRHRAIRKWLGLVSIPLQRVEKAAVFETFLALKLNVLLGTPMDSLSLARGRLPAQMRVKKAASRFPVALKLSVMLGTLLGSLSSTSGRLHVQMRVKNAACRVSRVAFETFLPALKLSVMQGTLVDSLSSASGRFPVQMRVKNAACRVSTVAFETFLLALKLSVMQGLSSASGRLPVQLRVKNAPFRVSRVAFETFLPALKLSVMQGLSSASGCLPVQLRVKNAACRVSRVAFETFLPALKLSVMQGTLVDSLASASGRLPVQMRVKNAAFRVSRSGVRDVPAGAETERDVGDIVHRSLEGPRLGDSEGDGGAVRRQPSFSTEGGIQAALVPLSGPDPTSPAPARPEVAEIQGLLEDIAQLRSDARRRQGVLEQGTEELARLKLLISLGTDRRRCHRCDLAICSLRCLLRSLAQVFHALDMPDWELLSEVAKAGLVDANCIAGCMPCHLKSCLK